MESILISKIKLVDNIQDQTGRTVQDCVDQLITQHHHKHDKLVAGGRVFCLLTELNHYLILPPLNQDNNITKQICF